MKYLWIFSLICLLLVLSVPALAGEKVISIPYHLLPDSNTELVYASISSF